MYQKMHCQKIEYLEYQNANNTTNANIKKPENRIPGISKSQKMK